MQIRKNQVYYLVKWEGWPESDNTWEPLEHLQQPEVKKMINDFQIRRLNEKTPKY